MILYSVQIGQTIKNCNDCQVASGMDLPPVMRLTLTGEDNASYAGTLYLQDASSVHLPVDSIDYSPASSAHYNSGIKPLPHPVFSRGSGRGSSTDPNGATYYVVAVVLVYGFSIVLLIASHIKRKNAKALEDRQINKYLQEFQVYLQLQIPLLAFCQLFLFSKFLV